MREAVWTACVAAAYALGFISALLCLEVSQELVSESSEQDTRAAGLYGRPLRSLARRITMQKMFAPEADGDALTSAGLGVATGAASVDKEAPAVNASVEGASTLALAGFHDDSDPRQQLNFYIGIFTTAGGDYTARRHAIRETWLPRVNTFDDLQAHFVVGKARGLTAQRAMAQERVEHNDFLELEMTDCYACLPEKTLQFFMVATSKYSTNFILKIDDDVYLNPQRLRIAAKQWNAMPAEYIGCMHKGPVLAQKDDRDSKWFEPAGNILGKEYWLNAFGSIYAVSGLVADKVIAPNAARLRRLANEDTSMGLWMLAFDVAFFDDTRLCGRACDPRAVSYWHIPCTGLCHPVEDTRLHHANQSCSGPGRDPLPYIDSWDSNKHFHALRKGVP